MKRVLLLLCFLPVAVYAQQQKFEYEFDHERPWVELQAQLPPYPETENLLQFDAGPVSTNLHYVDALSITVGEDGVVRYTLVITSSAGGMNVSYEGIRCQTAEKELTLMAGMTIPGRGREGRNGPISKHLTRTMPSARSTDIFSVRLDSIW